MRSNIWLTLACMGLFGSNLNAKVMDGISPQTIESNAAGETAIHLIVSVQGPVRVKRISWRSYAPAVFGTLLRRGDVLDVSQTSAATVVCSDLTMHAISPGIAGVPCTGAQQVLKMAGRLVLIPRLYQPKGPAVISPRRTKLLSNRPMLQWTAAEGVTSYRVGVRGIDLEWWTRVGSVTQLAYPKDAPPLKNGIDYKLIVTADEFSSNDDSAPGLGFSMLDAKEAAKVRREEQQIQALGLSKDAAQLLIAYLYESHGLNAEAIEPLEGLTKTSKEAAVWRFLGDLYSKIGLASEAEKRYRTGLNFSVSENDDEGEELAHQSLAEIYEQEMGNRSDAIKHLRAALASARKLGDEGMAARIEANLVRISDRK